MSFLSLTRKAIHQVFISANQKIPRKNRQNTLSVHLPGIISVFLRGV
ncbi:hypothetical protein HMPREF9214_1269 [Lactobacillus iners LactinV 11V1-d]|nr:hypothetical protein HMPREF9214_1269 [Lactobacillus iners LactinV 11V1-d]